MGSEWILMIRLFGFPFLLGVGSVVLGLLLVLAGNSAAEIAILVEAGKLFWQAGQLIALVGVAAALGLSLWRWILLYLWESGKLAGGCYNCGGPMSHKDGRYGAYSKCMICGSRREGWH